jgi:TPR repeat protein
VRRIGAGAKCAACPAAAGPRSRAARARASVTVPFSSSPGLPPAPAGSRAFALFERGAAAGHAGAAYALGVALDSAGDCEAAAAWLRRGAAAGHVPAAARLAALLDEGAAPAEDAGEMLRWLRVAADGADAAAQFALGDLYYFGEEGGPAPPPPPPGKAGGAAAAAAAAAALPPGAVQRNEGAALAWYRMAAAGGSVPARLRLFEHFMRWGAGLPPLDAAEAVRWLRPAADPAGGNDATAQSNLGCCYSDGAGVPRDAAAALEWWRLAAGAGDASAAANLRAAAEAESAARTAGARAAAAKAAAAAAARAALDADAPPAPARGAGRAARPDDDDEDEDDPDYRQAVVTRKRFTSIVKLVQKQIKKTVADVSAASKAGDDN